jgi:hypothetical protein
MKRLLLAALLLCSAPALSAPAAQPPVQSKIYAVVFRVTPDGSGGISDLQVDRVIDPAAPGTPEEVAARPVSVALPPAYIAAARTFLESIARSKGPAAAQTKVYYMYTFYDPSRPDRADILADKDQ